MQRQPTYTIRAARSADVAAIYQLKHDAFARNMLPYTIYQAPESVHYLRQLVEADNNDYFFVAAQGENILGYAHAAYLQDTYFFNYIAVCQTAQDIGLGRALLHHYEETGRSFGCPRLALDVFQFNQRVYSWYQRNGYQLLASSLIARLALIDAPVSQPPFFLQCDDDTLHAAYAKERVQGFSKIDGLCGPGQITLGFINRRVCKLLAFQGITLQEAVDAIKLRFAAERGELILPALTQIDPNWPLLAVDTVLRLEKWPDRSDYVDKGHKLPF